LKVVYKNNFKIWKIQRVQSIGIHSQILKTKKSQCLIGHQQMSITRGIFSLITRMTRRLTLNSKMKWIWIITGVGRNKIWILLVWVLQTKTIKQSTKVSIMSIMTTSTTLSWWTLRGRVSILIWTCPIYQTSKKEKIYTI